MDGMNPLELERLLEARTGLVSIGCRTINECLGAVRRSLPTMEQAVQLFERVAEALGERAWLDPDRAISRRLFLRDPADASWLVAWPFLEHQTQEQLDRSSFTIEIPVLLPGQPPGQPPPAAPKPEPPLDLVPRTANMRGGTLAIFEGHSKLMVRYDAKGLSAGGEISSGDDYSFKRHRADRPFQIDPTSRPPAVGPVSLLCRDDLDPAGHSVDALAEMVTKMALPERMPVRVRMPTPLPLGPHNAWQRALPKIREALWEGRIPDEARFLMIDGYVGVALASGHTRDEALARWADEVRRTEPVSPDRWNVQALPPPAPDEKPPKIELGDGTTLLHLGAFQVQMPPAPTDLKWPAQQDDVPAVLLPLPPLLDVPPAFRAAGFRAVRLVGSLGHVSHVFRRDDVDGFSLVGEGILDLVDPSTLDAALDACDAPARDRWKDVPPEQQPHNPWRAPERFVQYLLWDQVRQTPMAPTIPPPMGDAQAGALPPAALDGDGLKWQVVRVRRQL